MTADWRDVEQLTHNPLFRFKDRIPPTKDGTMLVWNAWRAAAKIEEAARAEGHRSGLALAAKMAREEAKKHLEARDLYVESKSWEPAQFQDGKGAALANLARDLDALAADKGPTEPDTQPALSGHVAPTVPASAGSPEHVDPALEARAEEFLERHFHIAAASIVQDLVAFAAAERESAIAETVARMGQWAAASKGSVPTPFAAPRAEARSKTPLHERPYSELPEELRMLVDAHTKPLHAQLEASADLEFSSGSAWGQREGRRQAFSEAAKMARERAVASARSHMAYSRDGRRYDAKFHEGAKLSANRLARDFDALAEGQERQRTGTVAAADELLRGPQGQALTEASPSASPAAREAETLELAAEIMNRYPFNEHCVGALQWQAAQLRSAQAAEDPTASSDRYIRCVIPSSEPSNEPPAKCNAGHVVRSDPSDPGKHRYCEREKGHTGLHSTTYCGQVWKWDDPAPPDAEIERLRAILAFSRLA